MSTPVYEVSFVVSADDDAIRRLDAAWSPLGELRLREGAAGTWSCVIITDRVGEAIETALGLVRPPQLQAIDVAVGEGRPPIGALGFQPTAEAARASVGVVPVVSGSGLVRLFGSLGAQGVVDGGIAMAPPVAELLTAVEEAPAEQVVVLPNSKAAIPIAEQIDSLTTKRVEVVPTRDLSQGIAAMAGYAFFGDDLERTAEDMAAAASAVVTGEVSQAPRDATVGLETIHRGEWIGVADGTLVVADEDLEAALRGLVAAILPPLAESITVYTGEGAEPVATKALEAWLSELHPEIRVRHVHGGQPGAAYLVSVE